MNIETDHYTLQAAKISQLPQLAWVATGQLTGGAVRVEHGRSVERGDAWVVEGVWDGEFAEGGFHATVDFFGSGVRCCGNAVYFVASAALTDRLVYCTDGDDFYVSNSLLLLLARSGARLIQGKDYRPEVSAIIKGVHSFDSRLSVEHASISFVRHLYHSHLVLSEGGLVVQPKPAAAVEPSSFQTYTDHVRGVLRALKKNYSDPQRAVGFSAVTTLSSGYDSTAVSVLAAEIGVQQSFSVKASSSWFSWLRAARPRDDGAQARQVLGLEPLTSDAPTIGTDEIYFFAGAPEAPELALYPLCCHVSKAVGCAVLFSGFHGDRLWGLDTRTEYLGADIRRMDMSGLSLCEARLHYGFVNVAIPFLLADKIEQIAALSRSEDMRPWRLDNGYDRPIPRRIAEQAGISRDSFGMHKNAVTNYQHIPRNSELRARYFAYLRRVQISPLRLRMRILGDYVRYVVARITGRGAAKGSKQSQNLLFVWSVNEQADALQNISSNAAMDPDKPTEQVVAP